METPDFDAETYETIPWAQLAPPATPMATRVGYWVVGALVALVLVYVLTTVLRDAPAETFVALEPMSPTAASAIGAESAAVTVTAPPPIVAAGPGSAVVYSEADLMAVIPEEEQRSAAARAEWFVTDLFTVDGDPQTAADVRAALPIGLDVALPHDAGVGVSYVEWARALTVRPDGPGRYMVEVAFRMLHGSSDGGLIRQPVRAVRVSVGAMQDGAAILDLPEAIPVSDAVAELVPRSEAELPEEIAAQLLDLVSPVGVLREVLHSEIDASGRRVIVSVLAPSGIEWPLLVRP